MDMPTNPEQPFILKEGTSREIGLYNRIAAINRVNYIVRQTVPDFDIYAKTDDYRHSIDREMHKRHYQDKPDAKIDEDFCQYMAAICVEFEQGIKEDPAPSVPLAPVRENPPADSAWKRMLKKLRVLK